MRLPIMLCALGLFVLAACTEQPLADTSGLSADDESPSLQQTQAASDSVPEATPTPSLTRSETSSLTRSPQPRTPAPTPRPTPAPPAAVTPSVPPPGQTRVSGRLLTAAGMPAAGVQVCLQTCPAAATTDANGNFSVDLLSGPIQWNFVYVVNGVQKGLQTVPGLAGPGHSLPPFTLQP